MDNFRFIYKNRELYKEMLHDIRCAQKYIYLETYIFDDDQIAETCWLKELLAAAQKTKSLCVGGRASLLLAGKKKVERKNAEWSKGVY